VRATVAELEGAYALAIVSEGDPDRIIVARMGCPVVLGLGVEENFVASDVAALLPVTRRFMFLDEGDVAEIQRSGVRVIDREGNTADRPIKDSELTADAAEKGPYRHFMLKEIHEQPRAVGNTLQERVANGRLLEAAFGPAASAVFERVEAVHIVACGTSYHAGVVASYMIESDLPHPVPGRDRQRIPLPQPGGAEECAVRLDLAVRRDRRHAGRAAHGGPQWLPVGAGDLQFVPRARWCANPNW
jgi:glucosamine--fructose-6-phosphate aminotransferase (isomerizing)